MNQQVSHLSLYDIAGTPGVGADVSHINTRAQVKVLITFDIGILVDTRVLMSFRPPSSGI